MHNAIRTEFDRLVNLAEKLDLGSDFDEIEDGVNFLSEVVNAHASEEEDVFHTTFFITILVFFIARLKDFIFYSAFALIFGLLRTVIFRYEAVRSGVKDLNCSNF